MKSILGILIVGILTLLLGWVLPWWSIGFAGFIGGMFFGNSSIKSFVVAFLGTGITWMLLALYIDYCNAGILSTKIALLFGGIPPVGLVLISSLIGGLASGFGGLTGYLSKMAFTSE